MMPTLKEKNASKRHDKNVWHLLGVNLTSAKLLDKISKVQSEWNNGFFSTMEDILRAESLGV